MNCPRCQQEVSPQSKFCRRCGEVLPKPNQAGAGGGESSLPVTRILGSPPVPAVSPPGGMRPISPSGGQPVGRPADPSSENWKRENDPSLAPPPASSPHPARPAAPPPAPPNPLQSSERISGDWKRLTDSSLVPPPAVSPRPRRSTGSLTSTDEPEMLSVRPEDFSLAPPTNVLIGPHQQAGFGLRFGAGMFDFTLYVLWFLVWQPVALFFSTRSPALAEVIKLIGTYGLLLVFVFNWIVLPSRTGQTVGKWLVGIKIITTGFGRVTLVTILKRHLLGYLVSSIFLIGFVWVLWDRRQQSWHDKIAHTLVVRVDI